MTESAPYPSAVRWFAFLLAGLVCACAQDHPVTLLANSPSAAATPQITAEAGDFSQSCRRARGAFTNGQREGTEIALSFDVCPTSHVPSFAADVVAYLKAAHVPATFFVSGDWARHNPDAFRTLKDTTGFEVALHGDMHPHLAAGAPDVIRREIEKGRAALLAMGAHPQPLFRPPYGDAPPELAAISRSEGVLPVLWDAALGDPDPNRTAALMERDAFRWVQAGSILVFHANGRGVATAETIAALVPALRARGYSFVPVSRLVDECGALPGRDGSRS